MPISIKSVTCPVENNEYSRDEFNEWSLKDLSRYFPDFHGIYDYITAPYVGSGYMIGVNDGDWYAIPLGHCSCRGPLEDCNHSIAYSKEDITTLVENSRDIDDNVKKEFLEFISKN